MAGLEPVLAEADWRALVGAVETLGRQRALVVLLTAAGALGRRAAACCPCVGRSAPRHRVVLASVRDPELERLAAAAATRRATYAAAAAEQAAARRDRTARLLATLGVDVLDADADELPGPPGRPLPRAQGAGAAL